MTEQINVNFAIGDNANNKRGLLYFFSILLIAYPVFYPVRDLLGHVGQYGLFAAWLFLAILNKPNFVIIIIKNSYLYIAFFAIIILRIIDVFQEVPNSFFSPYRLLTQFSIIFVYYIFGLWHILYSNNRVKRNLIVAFVISFLISTLITLYYLLKDPYAVRGSYTNAYFAIGDFNLIYTGVFLAALFLILIFKLQIKYKFKYIILFLMTILLVVKASYMTAFVFFFILLFLYIVLTIKKKYILYISIIFIMLSLTIIKMEFLSRFLIDIANSGWFNTAMKIRLEDIANALLNGSLASSDTILSRSELSSISWKTFLDNMLFGINYSNYNSFTIGHHTQWVDNLARFGVIGSLLLTTQLMLWYFQLLKYATNQTDKKLLTLCWLFFVLLGLVNNNMLAGLFVCMFFISMNTSTISVNKRK